MCCLPLPLERYLSLGAMNAPFCSGFFLWFRNFRTSNLILSQLFQVIQQILIPRVDWIDTLNGSVVFSNWRKGAIQNYKTRCTTGALCVLARCSADQKIWLFFENDAMPTEANTNKRRCDNEFRHG